MTDYQRTLDWLYALEAAKGMDFKLERVALALQRLGDPQRAYPALHIAGTNGKGSVAAMLDACLGAAGYRVGRYTSPHLVELGERITVGGEPMPREALVAIAEEIQRRHAGARHRPHVLRDPHGDGLPALRARGHRGGGGRGWARRTIGRDQRASTRWSP